MNWVDRRLRLQSIITKRVPMLFAAGLATVGATNAQAPSACKECAEWNVSQQPFRVYGNTYYVGVHGLSSILITSKEGHVLIDGDLPESAPKIAADIRALGFRLEDVKLILNSHVHFDHAGGIAELQRLSRASVAASEPTARAMKLGHPGPDDPQYGHLRPIEAISKVKVVKDGETLHVGSLALTAHSTPGHTPGGTSWTWKSCEHERCFNIVYADSLTAVSADGFRFTHSETYPNVLQDFERSLTTLSALPCDILLTPHPGASDLWAKLEKREHGADADAFVDATACRRYAETSRENLRKRLAHETGSGL
jgi:metallo-beta-lactamase class B